MRYVRREMEEQVLRSVKAFPAVVLTGPRRAGKTCLLRHLFPKADYFLLEDPDVVARLRADPQGFLDAVKTPAIPRRGAERAGGFRVYQAAEGLEIPAPGGAGERALLRETTSR